MYFSEIHLSNHSAVRRQKIAVFSDFCFAPMLESELETGLSNILRDSKLGSEDIH